MGIKVTETDGELTATNDGQPCEHEWRPGGLETQLTPVVKEFKSCWLCHKCLTGRMTDPEHDEFLEQWASYGT